MKVKYFIISMLFSLMFAGCEVTATNQSSYSYNPDRYDTQNIVSTILKTELLLNEAGYIAPKKSPFLDGYLNITYNDFNNVQTLYITSGSGKFWADTSRYYTPSLLSNIIYDYSFNNYNLEYQYYYRGTISNRDFGLISFVTEDSFYGLDNQNPYHGSLRIDHDSYTIYLDVIDEVYVDITLYDNYDDRYDLSFQTTWARLGF